MKKLMLLLISLICWSGTTHAQSQEVQQLLLNVEKLAQLKQILSDMEKGYRIVSSGYTTVRDLSQGNFDLHKAFLDGLMEVSPAVRKYRKVGEIISYQLQLVKEYKTALNRFRSNGHFSPDELDYIAHVYDGLFQRTLKDLDELTMVVTSGQLSMTDDERITTIDRLHLDMQDKLGFLRSFNNSTAALASERAGAQREVKALRDINGINN